MSNDDIIFCNNHQNKKAERYCYDCNEFICSSCCFQPKHLEHFESMKSFEDIIKGTFPQLESLDFSSLSNCIQLFHYIVNYNSSFSPIPINNLNVYIDEKFNEYINKLVEIKIKLKTLIAERIELMNSTFEKNEENILQMQTKIINLINNEDIKYFERMNECLEQINLNKNNNNLLKFVNEYNNIIKEAFSDENDFNNKYSLFLAQKEISKYNQIFKDNVLDKLIQPFFNENLKKLQNIYQNISNQNITDFNNLKNQFERIMNEPHSFSKTIDINNTNYQNKSPEKEKKSFQTQQNTKQTKTSTEQFPQVNNQKIPPKPKIPLLEIEFDPPQIETDELIIDDNYIIDAEAEKNFLQIEEDGDDGLLLAKIQQYHCSKNASVNVEQYLIDNMDDKLISQYYEGVKFEGENEGEGLNDEAVVEGMEDDIQKDDGGKITEEIEGKKEENKNKITDDNRGGNSPTPPESKNINNTPTQTSNKNKIIEDNNQEQKKIDNIIKPPQEKQKQVEIAKNVENKRPSIPKNKTQNDTKELPKTYSNLKGPEKFNTLINLIKSGDRESTKFQAIFNELTWEERGNIEIMGINERKNTIHIYNQYLNNIEEVKLPEKIPQHGSYINIPPYLYFSGGKSMGKDLNDLKKITRIGENEIKIESIGELLQGRSDHCTLYVPSINSLFFIGGNKIKSCEKYNITRDKVDPFPGLRNPREKCCGCVVNEKFLYVFFGFDRVKNKYETTIERIFINDALAWEAINVSGTQNYLKKHTFACIPFEKKDKKGVIIVGGINSLRSESKETVFINTDTNKADLFNNQLPCNVSFNNSYFVNFDKYSCSKDIYNITNDFKVVKFNLDNNNFSLI